MAICSSHRSQNRPETVCLVILSQETAVRSTCGWSQVLSRQGEEESQSIPSSSFSPSCQPCFSSVCHFFPGSPLFLIYFHTGFQLSLSQAGISLLFFCVNIFSKIHFRYCQKMAPPICSIPHHTCFLPILFINSFSLPFTLVTFLIFHILCH